jgi:hypothetical protein
MKLFYCAALLVLSAEAFVPGWTSVVNRRTTAFNPTVSSPTFIKDAETSSPLVLFAKKKPNAKLAALEALEALDNIKEELDAPMSKKEMKELEKKRKKEEKAAATEASGGAPNGAGADADPEQPQLSNKEEKLRKMMEMDAMVSAQDESSPVDDTAGLSKKELKALQKKQEKEAAKAAAKAEKKAQRAAELQEMNGDAENDVDGDSPGEEDVAEEDNRPTLEDKIRKERPPPRIRVMESQQPGFVSLRLEKVGITFRNQEVLKDVTWGVSSGDRIG